MEVTYSSEMLLPSTKPQGGNTSQKTIIFIHVNTSMRTLNVSKIFDYEFMKLQDSNTQRLKGTRKHQKTTGMLGSKTLPKTVCGIF
jgi:hypothetical protein